ncbi:ribonuclease H-like domain-containing protein, partial [Tanacetum coccineum]
MFNKPSFAKVNFVKSTEQVKSPRKTSVDKNRQNTPSPRGNKRIVNTVKGTRVNTVRPKSFLSVVKGNKGNVVKGNPQQDLKDKGVIDSGCSRHMTGNKSYLTDYEEIDGGFVAFGGNSKGGKITGKGKIRTGKLDFKDVYFVKELKFNLFSVSQMCDKKNSVLFTDTECVVLSPDFKMLFLMEDTYLSLCKATPDESNLCHGRIGHGIKREFSVPMTPQQNGVAERKNRTLIEATKTILADSKLPTTFGESKNEDSEVPSTEKPRVYQEKDDNVSSTNNVNTVSNTINVVSSTVNAAVIEVNVVDPKRSIELPNDPNMPESEDIVYSDDDEDVGAEAGMNNLDVFMLISLILTTRIRKDHPIDQIIGDLNSAPQTRRMTKNLKEH